MNEARLGALFIYTKYRKLILVLELYFLALES